MRRINIGMLTADNSNVTLAEADAYHADRLTPDWTTSAQPVREAACVRATDYITARYTLAQGVDRTSLIIKQATCALAAHALTSTLAEAAVADVVSEEADGVGKIAYGKAPVDPFPAITAMLRGVAIRHGGSFQSAKAVI
jgi:hypothetical protein